MSTSLADTLRLMAEGLDAGGPKPISFTTYMPLVQILFRAQADFEWWAGWFGMSPVDARYYDKHAPAGAAWMRLENDAVQLTYQVEAAS